MENKNSLSTGLLLSFFSTKCSLLNFNIRSLCSQLSNAFEKSNTEISTVSFLSRRFKMSCVVTRSWDSQLWFFLKPCCKGVNMVVHLFPAEQIAKIAQLVNFQFTLVQVKHKYPNKWYSLSSRMTYRSLLSWKNILLYIFFSSPLLFFEKS